MVSDHSWKGAGLRGAESGAREAGTRGGRTTRAAVEERTVEGGARRPLGHPELIDRGLVVAALAAIVLGGALHLAGRPGLGDATWAAGTIVVLVPLAWSPWKHMLHKQAQIRGQP